MYIYQVTSLWQDPSEQISAHEPYLSEVHISFNCTCELSAKDCTAVDGGESRAALVPPSICDWLPPVTKKGEVFLCMSCSGKSDRAAVAVSH